MEVEKEVKETVMMKQEEEGGRSKSEGRGGGMGRGYDRRKWKRR